jgi:predicted ATPase
MIHRNFVGRARELKILNQKLELMLKQQETQVVFIAGLAGEGKTTLVEYFAETAKSGQSETKLVATIGRCNQQTSAEEAYLPFRDILGQLTGNRPRLLNLTLDPQATVLSKSVLSGVAKALMEYGPDLLSTFVPGAALPARALATALDKGYHSFAQGQAERPELGFNKVAKQFTDTLRTVTKEHPMLIILDDLQWADNLSLKLFDHLRISLRKSRILFLVTYRTDEIEIQRDEVAHPLKEIVSVAKEESDAKVIILDSTRDKQAQKFITDLLAAMNVDADEVFAKALFLRTHGHPLLTVETLRYLQSSGHLVADESERWHVAPDFAWDKIPAQLEKLENLIQTRLNRLSADLREILNLASIEGQDFTAQVIMEILQKDESSVLRALSDELGQKHQLVSEIDESRIGSQVLSMYRFVNATFQRTVYESINTGERRLAHGKVARALEKLYGPKVVDIAVRLEQHYDLALEPVARAKHLIRIARQLYARTEYNESAAKYLAAEAIASSHGDNTVRIEARMYYVGQHLLQKGEKREEAWAELTALLEDARSNGLEGAQAYILRQLGIIQSARGQVAGAVQKYIQSLELAKNSQNAELQGQVITAIANRAVSEKAYQEAEDLFKRRLQMAVEYGQRQAQLVTLLNLSHLYFRKDEIAQAELYAKQTAELAEEMHADSERIGVGIVEAQIANKKGQYALSAQLLERSLADAKRLNLTWRTRNALIAYAESLISQERIDEAVHLLLVLSEDPKLPSDERNRIHPMLLDSLLPKMKQQHGIDANIELATVAEQLQANIRKPLIDLVIRACHSNDDLTRARAMEELDAILNLKPGCDNSLLTAIRMIMEGERDIEVLTSGLKSDDVTTIHCILASLAGDRTRAEGSKIL